MRTIRSFLSSLYCRQALLWQVLLVAVCYFGVMLQASYPLYLHFDDMAVGMPCDDLFDEMTLQKACVQELRHWRFPLATQALEYPLNKSLLITHKSYLHFIFAWPLAYLLPWPQWWNACVLSAIYCSALITFATIYYLSRKFSISFLLGLPFLCLPWTSCQINFGHLPQMWLALPFIALAALFLTLSRPDKRAPALILALFTILTSLVYWIWGGMLALCGCLALLWYAPSLTRPLLKRIGTAVAIVSIVILPIAVYTINLDTELPKLKVGGAMKAQDKQAALFRAWRNNITCSQDHRRMHSIWANAYWPATSLLLVAMLSWSWLEHRKIKLNSNNANNANYSLKAPEPSTPIRAIDIGFWLWLSILLSLIGIGPFLSWGFTTFTDSQGRLLRMPFYYLAEWTGLGYRWQLPQTVTPLIIFCIAVSCALAWSRLSQIRGFARYFSSSFLNAVLLLGLFISSCFLGSTAINNPQRFTKQLWNGHIWGAYLNGHELPDLSFISQLNDQTKSKKVIGLTSHKAQAVPIAPSISLDLEQKALPQSAPTLLSSPPPGYVLLGTFYPMFTAPKPAFAYWLANAEPGAIFELPSGYACNTWQLQHLHGHPTAHGKRAIPWSVIDNDYALLLQRLNDTVIMLCKLTYPHQTDWTSSPTPSRLASELIYGTRELPQACRSAQQDPANGKKKNVQVNKSFPNIRRQVLQRYDSESARLERVITPVSVRRDYNELYLDQSRYLVLHLDNCHWLAPGHGKEVYQQFLELLEQYDYRPIYRDKKTTIFLLPDPKTCTQTLKQLTLLVNMTSQY